MSTKRLWLVGGLVVVVSAAAWLLLRPTSYADRDWSALTPVVPEPAEVWEPDAAALARLDALDPCAVLRGLDPDVEDVQAYDDGCRTAPRRGDLRVELVPALAAEEADGVPASFAHEGDEVDAGGRTAWEVSAPSTDGDCAVLLPAGTSGGLLVRAASGPLCEGLGERVVAVLGPVDTPPFTPYGEPTLRGTGACADLLGQWTRRCAEHGDAEVPDDPVDAIREGEADPDLLCTAALGAAEEAGLDAELRAVTAGGSPRACVLLVGDRDVEVSIRTSRDPVGSSASLSVAGHAAQQNSYDAPSYQVALDDPAERGLLAVTFDTLDGSLTEPAWGRAFLEALVTDVLE